MGAYCNHRTLLGLRLFRILNGSPLSGQHTSRISFSMSTTPENSMPVLSFLPFSSSSAFNILTAHQDGLEQPSDNTLKQCLLKMLRAPGKASIYVILDALDAHTPKALFLPIRLWLSLPVTDSSPIDGRCRYIHASKLIRSIIINSCVFSKPFVCP